MERAKQVIAVFIEEHTEALRHELTKRDPNAMFPAMGNTTTLRLNARIEALQTAHQELFGEPYTPGTIPDVDEEQPYIERAKVVVIRAYNPKYGDDRVCECSHPYYRHFDTYEEMYPCGCKYCGCFDFKESVFASPQ